MWKKIIIIPCFIIIYLLALVLVHGHVYVFPLDDNIYKIRVSEKWGLIDGESGELLLEPIYDELGCYYSLIDVCRSERKNLYGLIDYNGNILLDAIYDKIEINQHLIIIQNKDISSVINKDGTEVLGPLEKGVIIKSVTDKYAIIVKNEQYALLSLEGKLIIDYLPKDIVISAINEADNIVYTRTNYSNEHGFINLNENLTINPLYENPIRFSDGIAIAKLNGQYGIINDANEVMIDFNLNYDATYGFHEGLAAVAINHKWGFIDQFGQIVIDIQYDSVTDFIGGMAKYIYLESCGTNCFTLSSEGFIGPDGQELTRIHNSSDDIDFINNKLGMYYINDDGTVYYKNSSEEYGFTLELNKKIGVTSIVNPNGEVIRDQSFSSVRFFNDNLFCVHEEYWNCYNNLGEKAIDQSFLSLDYDTFPYISLLSTDRRTHYLYDQDFNLIYKTKFRESRFELSESRDIILINGRHKIYTYNLDTEVKEVIYSQKYRDNFNLNHIKENISYPQFIFLLLGSVFIPVKKKRK